LRVANLDLYKFDGEFINISMDRLIACAEIVAEKARARCPVGTITRPVGKGKSWQERKPGDLKRTIRVVRKHDSNSRNVRIYAGNRDVYYARFVERGTSKTAAQPFLRPALNASKADIQSVLAGSG
jgi:HK97 gp10 family phage protein